MLIAGMWKGENAPEKSTHCLQLHLVPIKGTVSDESLADTGSRFGCSCHCTCQIRRQMWRSQRCLHLYPKCKLHARLQEGLCSLNAERVTTTAGAEEGCSPCCSSWCCKHRT